MVRISSCVPNLDVILHGGLPKNSTVLICGIPGSGKTVLANQIIFGNADKDNRALIISTISEPMSRLIQFTQEFSFFNVDKVGSAISYEDLGPFILKGNGEKALERILELVMEYHPSLLLIDSFKAIQDMSGSKGIFRRALYRLISNLAALSCTTLLVGEYDPDEIANNVEAALVDNIIELYNRPIGLRDSRSLRVCKLRGSGYIDGEHSFRISSDGIEIFPRTLTPSHPVRYTPSKLRAKTGIEGLDELLNGGFLKGTTTLIVGDPGVGKTVTALHFLLNGVKNGESGVYCSFQEDPNQLVQIAMNFGFEVELLQKKGILNMFYTSPIEFDADEQMMRIIAAVERCGAVRVVVDSISDFEAATARDKERYFNYVYSMVQWFKNRCITAVLTQETGEMFGSALTLTGRGVSHIADNLILLRYVPIDSEVKRALTVLSTRGSHHSKDVREYLISEKEGVKVGNQVPGGCIIAGSTSAT